MFYLSKITTTTPTKLKPLSEKRKRGISVISINDIKPKKTRTINKVLWSDLKCLDSLYASFLALNLGKSREYMMGAASFYQGNGSEMRKNRMDQR